MRIEAVITRMQVQFSEISRVIWNNQRDLEILASSGIIRYMWIRAVYRTPSTTFCLRIDPGKVLVAKFAKNYPKRPCKVN